MEVDKSSELVTIRSFASESEALIAKAALDAFGIGCLLSSDDADGQRPNLTLTNGIRLSVRREDAGAAVDVLENPGEELG